MPAGPPRAPDRLTLLPESTGEGIFGIDLDGQGAMVTFVDITERKRAADLLRQAHAELDSSELGW